MITTENLRPYIGTKLIKAFSMNRGEYNKFRNWPLPENENPNDDGYLVEYEPNGTLNVAGFEGYISWSPKDVFEKAYQSIGTGEMNFGLALECAKKELRIAMDNWPIGDFVVLMPRLKLPSYNTQESGPKVNDRTAKHIGNDTPLDSLPYFAKFTSKDKKWQPGWLPNNEELLATNWLVYYTDEQVKSLQDGPIS